MKEATELEIVNAYIDGLCITDIVKQFGIGRCSIYYYLKKYGVEPNRKRMDEKVKQELLELYNVGMKLKDINAKYGRHVDVSIYRYIKGDRLKHLNDTQQEFIKNNIEKMKQEDIAKVLGVTAATITYHKNKIK